MTILKYGAPSLRRTSQRVEKFDVDLEKLVADMFETMYAAPGVGIAAPQVGFNIRLIVIDTSGDKDPEQKIILCNPRIIASEGMQNGEEGCLSVPDFSENVTRPMNVTIEAQDIKGATFKLEEEGLLARAICHEIDHLDGIMFIDRISALKRALVLGKIKKKIRAGKW